MQRCVQVTRCTSQLAVMADDQAMLQSRRWKARELLQFDSTLGNDNNLTLHAVGKGCWRMRRRNAGTPLAENRSRTTQHEHHVLYLGKELAKVRQRATHSTMRKRAEVRGVAAPLQPSASACVVP